jgi:excisionase family DNA binding protein
MSDDRHIPGQQLLAVDQLAREFQLTPQTVRNWIKSGLLPAAKVGRAFRIKREDVNALLSRQQGESTPLGIHRDPWAPETLGAPYRPRTGERTASVWDGTSNPIAPPRRP